MAEEWRDIPSYEGRYQVSDQGRVRSLDRSVRAVSKAGKEYYRPVKGVVLAAGSCRGYQIINLWPNGTKKIHQLVADAFLPVRPSPLHEPNHIDGDKANNRGSNLEWLTKSDNMVHAVRSGLNTQALRVTDGRNIWPSMAQAAFELSGQRNGSHISANINGKRAIAFGRTWSLV